METKNLSESTTKRLHAIDVLRGLDMFWIVGGSAFVMSLARYFNVSWLNNFSQQFTHVPWEGFHFMDLIFPLFMFISGAVIPYSVLSKLKKGEPKQKIMVKAFKRMLLLIVLGIIYNGTLKTGFSEVRYASVLGQIGIAYFFTVIIVIYFKSIKIQLIGLCLVLLAVSLLQLFVPVPGVGAGLLTPEGNINGFIDRLLLPGRLAYDSNGFIDSGQGIYDALGILSTVSSIGVTFMGYFAGMILKHNLYSEYRRIVILTLIGILLIIIAILVHPVYPIIKNCWTTTFTFLTAGISFVLLAVFYMIVDVWGWKKWLFCFQVIGMNPLFIYLFYRMVKIRETSLFLLGWLTGGYENKIAHPIVAFGVILLVYGLLYFLYKKKVFVKI